MSTSYTWTPLLATLAPAGAALVLGGAAVLVLEGAGAGVEMLEVGLEALTVGGVAAAGAPLSTLREGATPSGVSGVELAFFC